MHIAKSQKDPRDLKTHPLNFLIYGEAKPDKDYVESIRANGTLEPVRIDESGTIISGHWRMAAAIEAGLETIAVLIYSGYDPVELEKLVLELNRRRPKTNEQLAREYQEIKRIEEVLARRRQKAGGVPQNSAEGGESRKIAAARVGMSHDTAGKASKVVKEIDKAQAAGDSRKAAELRETLNEQSVNAAYQKVAAKELVDAIGLPVPEPLREVFELVAAFKEARKTLTSLKSKLGKLCESPAGRWLRFNSLSVDLENVFQHIGFAIPYTVCFSCKGPDKSCKACGGTGWVNRSVYETANKGEAFEVGFDANRRDR